MTYYLNLSEPKPNKSFTSTASGMFFSWFLVVCMEYCDSETFSATCASSQIVVIDHARYGRMHIGRCVRTDYGYLGCSVNVVDVLDGICSGRRSCQFRVI